MSSPGTAAGHLDAPGSPTTAPQPEHMRSSSLMGDAVVELVDEVVPAPHGLAQLPPEGLVAPRVEGCERHALLLDPGEVPEVEDALAVALGALEEVVAAHRRQVLTERPGGVDLVVAAGVVGIQVARPLRPVQLRA